jgi:hypothetical protein
MSVELFAMFFNLDGRGGQNNGNTKKLRNRICVGYIEITAVGNTEYFLRLFLLCSACTSALRIVLSGSPCERIGKLETCPILK